MSNESEDILSLSAMVVSAYVANNNIARGDLPALINSTHTALCRLGAAPAPEPVVALVPAVSIKKSLTPDFLICLEDGLKFKSLKRHLNTKYGLSPEQYRTKWSLPADYPMVAPAYAEARSQLAKSMGLGRKLSNAPGKTTRAAKAKG